MNRKYRNLTFVIILFVVAVSFMTALYGLRHNNLRMRELRTAVFAADEKGDEEEVSRALKELRRHVLEHMNTGLRIQDSENAEAPIQLPHKYYRDTVAAWYEEIRVDGFERAPLDKARKVCETEDYVISERLNCLLEQTRHAEAFPEPEFLDKRFYVYDFPSPAWSPDLAGFSLIIFGFSLVVLVLRLLF